MTGGKGYVWIARYGSGGIEGSLRYLAADPSQMKRIPVGPTTHAYAPPAAPYEAKSDSESIAMEIEGGIYQVPVRFNDTITLSAVVDSGASDVSIPADIVLTLWRAKTINETDFLGTQTYILADGSKVPSSRFRLKSLKVGNRTIENVDASIADIKAQILLGQSFLSKFKSWSIDNERHALILK